MFACTRVRVSAGLLILALLGPMIPSAHAATADGLSSALAPVQTVVDESAALVGSALFEAFRDGTADAAMAKRDALGNFVDVLDQAWSLPAHATYGRETLAAFPYARDAFEAAQDFPETAGFVAVTLSRCEGKAIEGAEFTALVIALARMNITRDAFEDAASRAPAGIDASPLRLAASQLTLSVGDSQTRTCQVSPPPGSPPGTPPRPLPLAGPEAQQVEFLDLNLRPQTAWRGAQVRVFGSTSNTGDVQVKVDAWNVALTLSAVSQRFGGTFTVPQDAAFGPVEVSAQSGNLSRTNTLTIDRAPSRLTLSGPSHVQEADDVNLLATLTSPISDITNSATLRISRDVNGTFNLKDGSGTFTFSAPPRPPGPAIEAYRPFTATVVVSYAGNAEVAPTSETYVFEVTPLFALSKPEPRLDLSFLILPIILAVLVGAVAYLLFRWVRRLWRRPRTGRTPKGPAAGAKARHPKYAETTPTWRGLGIVAAFSLLARVLRRRGDIQPSTTARGMAARFDHGPLAHRDVVDAFERARYGGQPEDTTRLERVRTWARDIWARLTGGPA